ncbi:MAG: phenylalanine--tRNA ligase subunit beta [Lachnospiraceae bacterium]|nr:phenylalanine--tRNA ligase subunit beta [Lachnospiraceae bacterium]
MDTPVSWIKEYVPGLDVSIKEYCDAMTLSGTKVEGYKKLDKNLENIVVGRIDRIDPHPDAEKLVVCQVDVGGDGDIQIVTGAPNVKEQDLIPVVLAGGKVAGGHDGSPNPENGITIKKGKLRGVESDGMMCSVEELGSSKDYYPDAPDDGVFVFSDAYGVKPGDDAIAAMGLRDDVVEYEVTSNRVDCYSVIGIAREAAATFKKEFILPEAAAAGNDEKAEDYISVEIKDADLCSRYTARIVKNIRLAPSPLWMQRRLGACGVRPINNIVDITNYVMLEYGQPLHAFDYDRIESKKIVVKRAADGDKFITLDGKEHVLDSNTLMICDGEKEVAMAGIMGGENTMITDDVRTMLLESACFNGTNIRQAGRRLGMRTEAMGKFEKGLDPNLTMEAINRACQLVELLDAGDVVGGAVDVYPVKNEEKVIRFDPARANALLGTDISEDEMAEIFDRIELKWDRATNEVTVPTFRQDLVANADLAEEVARFSGYDNIPTTLPVMEDTVGTLSEDFRIQKIARNAAISYGFSESMTFSFESPRVFDRLLIPADDRIRMAVKIANPLGEDFSIMRTQPLNGMLTSIANNYNYRNKEARLFEMAKIYLPKALPITEYADERVMFTLGAYGADADFFLMKGAAESFLEKCGITELTYKRPEDRPYLHPLQSADIIYNGTVIGYAGAVHPDVCDNYGIGTDCYIAVIDLGYVRDAAKFVIKYKGLAKYPAIQRDISLTMDAKIPVGDVEEIIKKKGRSLLEKFELFDIYQGKQIKEGLKSVAYNLTFRAKDRTLEDKEVTEIMDDIIGTLEEKGMELRK